LQFFHRNFFHLLILFSFLPLYLFSIHIWPS
jgi:hypothetical protein